MGLQNFLTLLHSYILDPSRFPTALFALLLVGAVGMVTGAMHGNANPFYWKVVNGLFGGLGERLDRVERSERDLLTRGLMLTLMVAVFSVSIGRLAQKGVAAFPFYGVTEIILLSLTLTAGTVWFALLRLYFAMRDNKVTKGAYYAIAFSTRTDLSSSDDFGITRAGMAFAARSFDKGLVAPVLWYLIGGLPAAFLYAGLVAVVWRFGRDGLTKGIGGVGLALENLMGFVPSMMAGFLMAAAGLPTPTSGMTRAFMGLMDKKGAAPYAQGGLPLTALTHALHVTLGGHVTDLDGRVLKRDWIGPKDATARLDKAHLRRALYMHFIAWMILMASLGGGMMWGRVIKLPL